MNPLLNDFTGKFGEVPFDQIKVEHFLPALNESIALAKKQIAELKANPTEPNFENTILAMEYSGEWVSRNARIFFSLNGAETNAEIQALAREISPMLSQYSNDIMLDQELFQRVKKVYDRRIEQGIAGENLQLLEKSYKGFVRNGALLPENKKDQLRRLDQELSQLSLKFGENDLAETNSYQLVIDNASDLAGMPEGIIEAAATTAKQKGLEGKWVFTLHYPSYGPFMTYCQNSSLRQKMYMASATKAAVAGEHDNREIVKQIALKRHQRAQLLGFATHSNFVLEERMAGKPETVWNFMNDILVKAKPAAEREQKELENFAKKMDGAELKPWDIAYYSEKLKKEKFSIDDEMLRPYLQLEKVVEGAFTVANKLYGLSFHKVQVPGYHAEVEAYEVKDGNRHMGLLYTDFFPRAGKRSGAWATSFRGQEVRRGVSIRPHASIVCNFTRPTESKPSLLTFREMQTLFHEFGHALHTLLADTTHGSLSGTSVYWDFVELPSQVMENWTYEMEALELFARHFQTGAVIPHDLVKKLKDSSSFREGTMTLRQLNLGMLDMSWYSRNPESVQNVEQFEIEAGKSTSLMAHIPGTVKSTSFGHIFAGGYSSGYYSYKWAEVLDADTFEFFKEKGIFNKDVAKRFRDNVLSQGGTKHPMDLYVAFRGKEPSVDALLRRGGLI